MIRALIEQTFDSTKKYLVLFGLSTDNKPVSGLITGSEFHEVDTGVKYEFDEVNSQWHEVGITEQEIKDEIDAWLDDHPEATTTVEDGSITNAKLASSFVTPGTAAAYSSSATYAVGDYCFHNGSLYRCTTAITTAEAWTAGHWTAAVLGDDVGELKSQIDKILVANNIIKISNATLMHTVGDATISFDNANGFTYTRVTSANNQLGFAFPTQAQKKYTLTLDVSNVVSGDGVRIYVCPTSVYNSSGALAFEDWVATDKTVTLEFTAQFEESSLWFYVRYNVPSCKISNISVDDGILRYNKDIMDYDGTEISVFNKIACVGDSITEGTFNYTENGSNDNVVNISKYSYPTILKKLTGVETDNLGRGGNTSVQWYSYYQNEDLSGYDAVIIMLGINDGVYSVSVSDFSDAICNIIDKFKAENNGIRVFLSTIIPAYTDYDRKFDNYNTEIRRIATEEYTDVFLIDINKYSICKHFTYYQQGHLTAVGYQQLAKEFATLISYTIYNNLDVFRNVQFIGTNYTYTEE